MLIQTLNELCQVPVNGVQQPGAQAQGRVNRVRQLYGVPPVAEPC